MVEKHQLGFYRRSGIAHEGGVHMVWWVLGKRLSIVGGVCDGGEEIEVLASIVVMEPDLDPMALTRHRAGVLKLAWRDLQAAPEVSNDA